MDDARESDWLRGDWMQTFSGGRYYPSDPKASDIVPSDIGHALGYLCRYGGHVARFYSVAEHCVLMSMSVPPEDALHALLHDATEAYVVDVPRPVKRQLSNYADLENGIWLAIAERFGIDPNLPESVHEADNRILLTEKATLLPSAEDWPSLAKFTPLPVLIRAWDPTTAGQKYMTRLKELTDAK